MAEIQTLKDKITSTIYPNGQGAITAAKHQELLLEMADTMDETHIKLEGEVSLVERGISLVTNSSSLQYIYLPFVLQNCGDYRLRYKRGKGTIYVYTNYSEGTYVTHGEIKEDSPYLTLEKADKIDRIGIYAAESSTGAELVLEPKEGCLDFYANTCNNCNAIVQESFEVLPKLPQMLNKDAFLADMRPNQGYGANINDLGVDANWTVCNPIYFTDGSTKTLATNLSGSTFYLATYQKNGENYTRTGSIISGSSWSQVGDHYEYTLNNNMFVAVRCWIVTSNMPAEPKMTLAEDWEDSSSIYRPSEVIMLRGSVEIENGGIPFIGKKICGVGDSIMVGVDSSGTPIGTQGKQLNSVGGWLGALREKYPSINTLNMGVASTTMLRNNAVPANSTYGCILDRMDSIPSDYDYILLAGGVNDFFHKDTYSLAYGDDTKYLYDTPVSAKYENGKYSNIDYMMAYGGGHTGDLDATTFCGAIELAMVKLVTRFHDKKIGFIIYHSMRPTEDFNKYMDYAKKMCAKYGVPCLDMREVVSMPRIYAIAGNSDGSSLYTIDGVHPNELGYRQKYLPAIEAWLKTL